LDNLRHGNWPKELARLAQDGLDAEKSLHAVCCEMAKYLYWYDQAKVMVAALEQLNHVQTVATGAVQVTGTEQG